MRAEGEEFVKRAADELSSPLLDQFIPYVEALVGSNRHGDVEALIHFFDPIWEYGNRQLGTAAFKIGKFDVAERYLLKFRNGAKDYCRAEEMGCLAEIWAGKGRASDAQALLIDCLKGLVTKVKESKYRSDQEMFEKEFQHHRQTFLRLFPQLGESELARHNVPSQTISS